MMASNMMKQKGYKIEQYVLEGIVCIENNKYTLYDYNPYKDFIKIFLLKIKEEILNKYIEINQIQILIKN